LLSIAAPELGLIYVVLDHYGMIDPLAQSIEHLFKPVYYQSNYQSPVCPQDNTIISTPNLSY